MIRLLTLSLIILLSLPCQAYALSCPLIEVDQNSVANADIIFEGTVVGIEKHAESKGGDNGLNRLLPFDFNISKIWKSNFENGVVDTDNLTIMRNVYWGDDFKLNKSYLIFANKKDNGDLVAELCGITIHSDHADDAKQKLNNILNNSNSNKEKSENE